MLAGQVLSLLGRCTSGCTLALGMLRFCGRGAGVLNLSLMNGSSRFKACFYRYVFAWQHGTSAAKRASSI